MSLPSFTFRSTFPVSPSPSLFLSFSPQIQLESLWRPYNFRQRCLRRSPGRKRIFGVCRAYNLVAAMFILILSNKLWKLKQINIFEVMNILYQGCLAPPNSLSCGLASTFRWRICRARPMAIKLSTQYYWLVLLFDRNPALPALGFFWNVC